MASGVIRVGRHLRVSPLYFFMKNLATFFLVASSAVSSLVSSSQKLTTFSLIAVTITIAFYCFHSGVTPFEGVTPHLFYLSGLVSPLIGCHPLEGVTRGGRPSPPPSDTTDCGKCKRISRYQSHRRNEFRNLGIKFDVLLSAACTIVKIASLGGYY